MGVGVDDVSVDSALGLPLARGVSGISVYIGGRDNGVKGVYAGGGISGSSGDEIAMNGGVVGGDWQGVLGGWRCLRGGGRLNREFMRSDVMKKGFHGRTVRMMEMKWNREPFL